MGLFSDTKARFLGEVLRELSDHPELQEDIQKLKDIGGQLLAKAIPLAERLAVQMALDDSGAKTEPAPGPDETVKP